MTENKIYLNGTLDVEIVGLSGEVLETIILNLSGDKDEVEQLIDCISDAIKNSKIVPGDTIKISPVQY